jgi:HK97 family phage major capsid protein
VDKKQFDALLKLLRGIDEQLKNPAVTREHLEKLAGEIEERIKKGIPLEPMRPVHAVAGPMTEARKHLNSQVRFMLNYDRASKAPKEEQKALGLAVGAEGGFLVPEEFIAEVDRKLVAAAVFRPNARVFPGVGKKGSMPRETGTVTMLWENENVATAETGNPSFGQIIWNLNKLKALTKLSTELFQNEKIDITDLLSDMIAEQAALTEDAAFMNGSGAGRPTGLRLMPGYETIAQIGANLAYDDFVNIKHLMLKQYRNGAAWMMHNDIIALAAKMRDDYDRPVFLDMSLFGGQGTNQNIPAQTVGFILGLPIFEQNDIPTDLGGGSNESEILLANLKRAYFIFDGGNMEMSSTTEGFGTFESDQIAVKGLKFVDGKGANEDALVAGTGIK